MAADKFEVASCMRYCSHMLRKFTMTSESALLYLDLPSSVLMADAVKPLTDEAKKFLGVKFKDIRKYHEEVMNLPLAGIEAVLSSDQLQVASEDVVYDFAVKWATIHYTVFVCIYCQLNLRSSEKNSAFRRLFALPPEEFLIKDYSCSLKRRMHLQESVRRVSRELVFLMLQFLDEEKFKETGRGWNLPSDCRVVRLYSIQDVQLNSFNPSSLSSASVISCSDKRCSFAAPFADALCDNSNNCAYQFHYGDGSGTEGYYVSDVLSLTTIVVLSLTTIVGGTTSSNSSASVSFGC